jgi:hypothetical protein
VSCLHNRHVSLNQSSIPVRSGTAVVVNIGAAVVAVAALLLVLQSALVWAVFAPLLVNLTPPILHPINDPWLAWVVRFGCSFELLQEGLPVRIVLFALSSALPPALLSLDSYPLLSFLNLLTAFLRVSDSALRARSSGSFPGSVALCSCKTFI